MPRCALLLLSLALVPACTFSEKVVNHYHYYGDTGGEEDSAAEVDSGGVNVDSGGADGQEPVLPPPVIWEGTLTVEVSGSEETARLVLSTQPAVDGALVGPITTVESDLSDIVMYGMFWPIEAVVDGMMEDDGAAAGRITNTATAAAYWGTWAGGLSTSGPEGTTMTGLGDLPIEMFSTPVYLPARFSVTTPTP